MTLYGKEHIERYLATDGAEGHSWVNGTTTLLLFTKGRSTGTEYFHPLIYREYDNAFVVVASKGGAPQPPQWYLNLSANPDAMVQVKGDRFLVRAHTATPDEKSQLWKLMTEVWPDYDKYQEKTSREIPVVVLERR